MHEASSGLRQGFRLGPWRVEPLRGAVIAPGGESRHVEPKVMDVLVRLAERAGELVTRDELADATWTSHVGADQLLTRAVSELRRVLDDSREAPSYIETVPKRGYRLLADVHPLSAETASAAPARPMTILAALVLLAVAAAGLVFYLGDESAPDAGAGRASLLDPLDVAFDDGSRSIAVLPFAEIGADAGDTVLSQGLAEEIRNLIAGVPGVKVIGRRSSSAFGDGNADARTIGRALGVSQLLDGTVQRAGERVRIRVQLIDARDGSVIWSDSFSQTLTDIFALQEQVAIAVLDAMQVHVAAYPARGRPTDNADAYGLYLQARQSLTVQHTVPAETALKQAVALDPQFAEAWELLAFTYWVEPDPARGFEESVALIRQATSNALAIDPDRPFARALHYEANTDEYALADAIVAYIEAARRQPNDPSILRTLSWHLTITGYFREALEVTTRMVEIDPLSSMSHIRHSVALRSVGRWEEAKAALETAHHLDPGGLAWYLGETSLDRGDVEEAVTWFKRSLADLDVESLAWVRAAIEGSCTPGASSAALDRTIAGLYEFLQPEVAELLEPGLERWYLFCSHLDRYYDLILERGPGDPRWTKTEMHVWYGMFVHEEGFTGHPAYLGVAKTMGHVDVWERLGPPDHCRKQGDGWTCD